MLRRFGLFIALSFFFGFACSNAPDTIQPTPAGAAATAGKGGAAAGAAAGGKGGAAAGGKGGAAAGGKGGSSEGDEDVDAGADAVDGDASES